MKERVSTKEVEEQITDIQADYKYRLSEFTIGELNRKFSQRGEQRKDIEEEMSILFVPKYQREFVWSEIMQSRFIESIFMGVPIQPLFAFELNDEGNLELLDGVQRLSTVKSFSDNNLILNNLEELTNLNNYKFENLEASRKRKFLNTSLKVYIINENTDEGVRADIFRRINETGQKLESAEIRKGKFIANEFYDFILKCSELDEFSKLFSSAKNKEKLRGEKEELITRFFAFSDNYKNFVHSVKGFMDDYIIEKGKTYSESIGEEKLKEFKNMLNYVNKYLPNGFTKSKKSLSIPRVRFEAISVGVNLALKENNNLENPNIEWLESKEFKQWTTSDASNNKNKLTGRIEFVKNCLLGIIDSKTLNYED